MVAERISSAEESFGAITTVERPIGRIRPEEPSDSKDYVLGRIQPVQVKYRPTAPIVPGASAPNADIVHLLRIAPPALTPIVEVIKKSLYILRLEDNWDGEGSPAYSKETWERAAVFLLGNTLHLWRAFRLRIAPPAISHGPEGSIDIYWKSETLTLLINIPDDHTQPATYYGTKAKGEEAKGKFDLPAVRDSLLLWTRE